MKGASGASFVFMAGLSAAGGPVRGSWVPRFVAIPSRAGSRRLSGVQNVGSCSTRLPVPEHSLEGRMSRMVGALVDEAARAIEACSSGSPTEASPAVSKRSGRLVAGAPRESVRGL